VQTDSKNGKDPKELRAPQDQVDADTRNTAKTGRQIPTACSKLGVTDTLTQSRTAAARAAL
jgi:hypothetical protein